MLKKIILMIGLIAVSLNISAASGINEINLHWLNENYSEVKQDIESGNVNVAIPLANTLGLIWLKRDGATSGEVSPLIAKLLIEHPTVMLAVLAEHPEEYKKWLNELQSSLLTDFVGGEEQSLEAMRKELISVMDKYDDSKGSLHSYASQLATQLKELNVRVID